MKMSPWERFAKRLFDLTLAAALLVLLSPLLLGVAAAIRFTSGAPVFFLQHRDGLRGRSFRIIKFRTMTSGTVPEAGRETQADDPRITRVGRWLRASGIDELPQLLNVLAGDMSMVGPRPLLRWENDQCDARQVARLAVRPGLTGLSQVNGRNRIPWAQRVEWDVAYVERASLLLDVAICLRTLPVVLLGRDAYRTRAPELVPAAGPDATGEAIVAEC